MRGATADRRVDAKDVLIFRVTDASLDLVGGSGRGAGWSGIVSAPIANEPLVARVRSMCRPVRVDGEGEAVHVIGPYWARHAVLVPVGAEYLVAFGGDDAFHDPDAAFLPAAAGLVAELDEVAPAKLLADELELVHAIRGLMDYRPDRVSETARHIAATTAEALSCEVGAVLVRHDDRLVAEVVTRDWPVRLDPETIRATLVELFERCERGAVLELDLEAAAGDALGREQGLVARFALPIGRSSAFGVLVVAHAAVHARGFTTLCQRIGHALADAAESLLVQAISREGLTAERDRLAREARIDPLTGLDNRSAWDHVLLAEEARRDRYARSVTVVTADLDSLKTVNDRYGHGAGDQLIRAAADLLRRCARSADRIARVGGDEFVVLLPETDAAGGAQFLHRVRAAARRGQLPDGVELELSLGAATAEREEPLAAVVDRADRAMYANKKRRARRAGVVPRG